MKILKWDVRKDFEQGLDNLKNLVESLPTR